MQTRFHVNQKWYVLLRIDIRNDDKSRYSIVLKRFYAVEMVLIRKGSFDQKKEPLNEMS
ncbi:MAG: hypothetical protein ACM34K_17430 [Bacillota bacterium]